MFCFLSLKNYLLFLWLAKAPPLSSREWLFHLAKMRVKFLFYIFLKLRMSCILWYKLIRFQIFQKILSLIKLFFILRLPVFLFDDEQFCWCNTPRYILNYEKVIINVTFFKKNSDMCRNNNITHFCIEKLLKSDMGS